jgi:hypothetical protein
MAPQISVHGAEAARQFRSPAVEIPRRALRTSRPNVLFRASYALIVVHYGTRKRRSKNLIKAAMLSGWNCKCLEDRRGRSEIRCLWNYTSREYSSLGWLLLTARQYSDVSPEARQYVSRLHPSLLVPLELRLRELLWVHSIANSRIFDLVSPCLQRSCSVPEVLGAGPDHAAE